MKTRQQIIEFIQKQKTVFIGSVDEEGYCFYFSTNTSSMRTQQFMRNPKASVYFYNRGRFKFEGIMLTGTIEVLQDDDIKQEIWCTGDTMYYRQGVTDPDYCVLKFTAIKGRHYCNLHSVTFCFADA